MCAVVRQRFVSVHYNNWLTCRYAQLWYDQNTTQTLDHWKNKRKSKEDVFTFNESLFQSDVLTFYQACVRKMILRQRTEPESKLK